MIALGRDAAWQVVGAPFGAPAAFRAGRESARLCRFRDGAATVGRRVPGPHARTAAPLLPREGCPQREGLALADDDRKAPPAAPVPPPQGWTLKEAMWALAPPAEAAEAKGLLGAGYAESNWEYLLPQWPTTIARHGQHDAPRPQPAGYSEADQSRLEELLRGMESNLLQMLADGVVTARGVHDRDGPTGAPVPIDASFWQNPSEYVLRPNDSSCEWQLPDRLPDQVRGLRVFAVTPDGNMNSLAPSTPAATWPVAAARMQGGEARNKKMSLTELTKLLRGFAEQSPDFRTHTRNDLWALVKGRAPFKQFTVAMKEAFAGYPEWQKTGARKGR